MKRPVWRTWTPFLLLLVVAFPVGLVLGSRGGTGDDPLAGAPPGAVPPGAIVQTSTSEEGGVLHPAGVMPAGSEQASPDSRRWTPIVEAANRVAPSVVSISILRVAQAGPRSLLDDFFGEEASRSRLQRS